MSAESAKAAAVTPPVESNNVVVLDGSTTAQRIKLPDTWRKSWLTIQADGVNVGYVLGGATVAADLTGTTTITDEEIDTFDGGECKRVDDGGEKHEDLSQILRHAQDLFISIDCDATAGYVVLIRSSGTVNLA